MKRFIHSYLECNPYYYNVIESDINYLLTNDDFSVPQIDN